MISTFLHYYGRLKWRDNVHLDRLEMQTFQYTNFYGTNQLGDLDLNWNMVLRKQLFELTELTYNIVRLWFLYTRKMLLDSWHTGSFFVGVIILRWFIFDVLNKSLPIYLLFCTAWWRLSWVAETRSCLLTYKNIRCV
jgi:hypothetical protein